MLGHVETRSSLGTDLQIAVCPGSPLKNYLTVPIGSESPAAHDPDGCEFTCDDAVMSVNATTGPNDTPSALAHAVADIERHVGAAGWDQPARLYALAATSELVAREPALASRLGIDSDATASDTLTPIEQDTSDRPIEELLATISWPSTVSGCAMALERIVLPPSAEDEMPDNDADATTWAQRHPGRSDVRVVVGVLRDGSRVCALRVRGHDQENELIIGAELSPELGDALVGTFQ
jgi:hypothetical protein